MSNAVSTFPSHGCALAYGSRLGYVRRHFPYGLQRSASLPFAALDMHFRPDQCPGDHAPNQLVHERRVQASIGGWMRDEETGCQPKVLCIWKRE